MENYYTSSDLGLVAALSLTYEIKKIDRTDPRKVVFSFEDSKELQKKIIAFDKKKLKVDAQSYFQQIRAIKIMIYERKREEPSKDTKVGSNTN